MRAITHSRTQARANAHRPQHRRRGENSLWTASWRVVGRRFRSRAPEATGGGETEARAPRTTRVNVARTVAFSLASFCRRL